MGGLPFSAGHALAPRRRLWGSGDLLALEEPKEKENNVLGHLRHTVTGCAKSVDHAKRTRKGCNHANLELDTAANN